MVPNLVKHVNWLILFLAFLLSYALTVGVLRYGRSSQLLDHPNARSSHSIPTLRGGGLSIVITTTLGILWLYLVGTLDLHFALAVIGGGLAVALVGFMDDRASISVLPRIAVHIGAAVWAMYMLGGLPALQIGGLLIDLGIYGYILGTLAIVWTLNLFNFMDGIDGIAASEAVFVAWSGALISLLADSSGAVIYTALVLGAACFGFLLWNWPPAKIFMGDVGSGYIGYVVAVLAVAAAGKNSVALFVWLILGGVFFVDATITLGRRLFRYERVHEAHRSHAYQWLALRWRSHQRVTVTVIIVNVIWLLPCALLATIYPAYAVWITAGALAPIVLLVIISGAGRREMH